MTINTRHYGGSTSTVSEGDREFVLPISAGHADEYRLTVLPDGDTVVTYLAVDEYGGDMFTPDELFQGWEYMLLTNQRDADAMSTKFHTCDECGENFNHTDADEMAWYVNNYDENEAHEFVNKYRTAMAEGRCFYIEKYEHGLVRYALVGESSAVDRQWDVTGVAGYLMADDDWGPDVDIRQAARNTLATYTDWCNGNIYGVITVQFDADGNQLGEEEACWGYIGDEHATQVMIEDHTQWTKETE